MLCRTSTLVVFTLAFLPVAGCAASSSTTTIDAYYAHSDMAPLAAGGTAEAFPMREYVQPKASAVALREFAIPETDRTDEENAQKANATEPVQASAPPEPPPSQRARALRELPENVRRHVPRLKLDRFQNVRGQTRTALYARIESNTAVEDKVGLLVAILAADGEQDVIILHTGGLLAWSCEGTAWVRSEIVRNPDRSLDAVERGMRHFATRLRMGQLPSDAQLWMRTR